MGGVTAHIFYLHSIGARWGSKAHSDANHGTKFVDKDRRLTFRFRSEPVQPHGSFEKSGAPANASGDGPNLVAWVMWTKPQGQFEKAVDSPQFSAQLSTAAMGCSVPSGNIKSALSEASCVIYFHGNSAHLAREVSLQHYKNILERSAKASKKLTLLLAFDYRGFGQSGGSPSEAGLIADGMAAVKLVTQRWGISPSRTLLLGFSLGSAVAIATYEQCLLHTDIHLGALMTSGSFTDSHALLRTFRLNWFCLPYNWLCFCCVPCMIYGFEDTWKSTERLGRIFSNAHRFNVTLVHSADDWNIWYRYSLDNYTSISRKTLKDAKENPETWPPKTTSNPTLWQWLSRRVPKEDTGGHVGGAESTKQARVIIAAKGNHRYTINEECFLGHLETTLRHAQSTSGQ